MDKLVGICVVCEAPIARDKHTVAEKDKVTCEVCGTEQTVESIDSEAETITLVL